MGCANSKAEQSIREKKGTVPKEYSTGSIKLIPIIGFTIKFVIKTDRLIGKVNYKGKFFINLLHHDEIPTIVIGDKIRQANDKGGNVCHSLDVTINTQLFLLCSVDVEYRNYIISQIIKLVNNMTIASSASLDLPYEYVLPNIKRGYIGDKVNTVNKNDHFKYPIFPDPPFDKNLHVVNNKKEDTNVKSQSQNNPGIKPANNTSPVKVNKVEQISKENEINLNEVKDAIKEKTNNDIKKEYNFDEILQNYASTNDRVKGAILIGGAIVSRPSGPSAINVVHKRAMLLTTNKADYGKILFFNHTSKELKGEFHCSSKLKVNAKGSRNYEFEYDSNVPPSTVPFIDDKNDLSFWEDIVKRFNTEMALAVIPKELENLRSSRIDDDNNNTKKHDEVFRSNLTRIEEN